MLVQVYDFPGFEGRIDGQPVPHMTHPETGFVLMAHAPEGASELRLERAPSRTTQLGAGLSALTALILLALAMRRERP